MAVAGAAGMLPFPQARAAEPAPEVTTVRLAKMPTICFAPQYVCEDLLRMEGFSDIRYVDTKPSTFGQDLAEGKYDFASNVTAQNVVLVDSGLPITLVSGIHAGCYELFASDGIRSIRDLKAKPLDQFIQGKLDAYMALPPEPQLLHARGFNEVIVRTATDRPWSQYFCCTLAARRDYVARNPVATKRVIRAMLKAADLCASEPERVARRLVDGGFVDNYEYAAQTLKDNPYAHWRDYDGEDTVRFYALRLHEVGVVKKLPQRIIADGTDFRFFDELKRELKT
jgi:NitT/TauT family transport system substrate-binding protein